jgi:hypothetical protein
MVMVMVMVIKIETRKCRVREEAIDEITRQLEWRSLESRFLDLMLDWKGERGHVREAAGRCLVDSSEDWEMKVQLISWMKT